jgi:hypothetical protein
MECEISAGLCNYRMSVLAGQGQIMLCKHRPRLRWKPFAQMEARP